MAGIRYKASYAGTSALMNGPEMQEMLRGIAEKGKTYAESIAPVGVPPEDRHPGEYKTSFEVQVRSHGGVHGDRAEAKIVNTAVYAAALEWGNGAFPPFAHGYHVLNRAAQALGSL